MGRATRHQSCLITLPWVVQRRSPVPGKLESQTLRRIRSAHKSPNLKNVMGYCPSSYFPATRWTCIYPIYIDAKRPYATGARRISRSKSVWWPLSKDIADACSRLGLGTLHEVNKMHPSDWENPGRVRVQWKKDGRPVNSNIRTSMYKIEN